MTAIEELGAAIEAARWEQALDHALAMWRDTRATEVAALVDLVAARCEPVKPVPWYQIADWWPASARTYQPALVHALEATAAERAYMPLAGAELAQRYPEAGFAPALADEPNLLGHGRLVERMVHVVAWPADPRAARLLASWLVDGPINWHKRLVAARGVYEMIAARLIELADPRTEPVVQSILDQPRGKSDEIRAWQVELAHRILDAIAARPPTMTAEDATRVAGWCARLSPSGPAIDDHVAQVEILALWQEAVKFPDDDARRLVLADALLDRGDDRGELIVLQCAGTPEATQRARSLLSKNRERWLGDLALASSQHRTEFRRGFLDELELGYYTTPPWVYAKLTGHRELLAVRTVRPHHTIAPAHFVEVVANLAHVPDRIAATQAIVVGLLARRDHWPVRALEFRHTHDARLAELFPRVAVAMPALEEIRFELMRWPRDDLASVVAALPHAQPALTRIVIAPSRRLDRALLDPVASLPLVEVEMTR